MLSKIVPRRIPSYRTVAVIISCIVVSSIVVGDAISKVATLISVKNERDYLIVKRHTLESLRDNIEEQIATENEKAMKVRENVLKLDTYLSFVKGYWPRLYLTDIIGSDEIEWAYERMISDDDYAATVRQYWKNATNENFFAAAEIVESAYKFVIKNVEFLADENQFPGKLKVYIPPDHMIDRIRKGGKAYGDCEDYAILLLVLLKKAFDNGKYGVDPQTIVVNEGLVAVPTNLQAFVDTFWRGLSPLYILSDKIIMDHTWVEIRIPDPIDPTKKIKVALEPTQYLPDKSHAPWDTWVIGSPNAKAVSETAVKLGVENYSVQYPLHGYVNGHSWVEFKIWRQYGLDTVSGMRPDYRFPDANSRLGMLRADLLVPHFRILESLYGSANPCDLLNWQDYY